jgi:hypothetical protein
VLVLDWSGTDYAPYWENTVRITDIALDEESILSYLEDPQVCSELLVA